MGPNYWDRALRERDYSREILEYLLSDPLRSGLVQRLEDYPFIGSVRWTQRELIFLGGWICKKGFLDRIGVERPG